MIAAQVQPLRAELPPRPASDSAANTNASNKPAATSQATCCLVAIVDQTIALTHNPLRIAFHEWINLARDLRDSRSAGDVWRALFAPPQAREPAAH